MELAAAGLNLVTLVASIVAKAVQGDPAARAKVRRVEEILTESPTKRAWAKALAAAESLGRQPTILPPTKGKR